MVLSAPVLPSTVPVGVATAADTMTASTAAGANSITSASLSSSTEAPPPDSLFEGPEKSLRLRFILLTANATMRALTRPQIDSILDAARCTVLSVVSNRFIDAYLLSESSLFVSAHALTMKTCGTTTLLNALPLILDLAAAVHCAVAEVQFSRVAYLFPDKQVFPHGCFEDEVAHLDLHLGVRGRVTCLRNAPEDPQWFLYSATFPSGSPALSTSTIFSDSSSQDSFEPVEEPIFVNHTSGDHMRHCATPCNADDHETGTDTAPTLEVCMFDLDPDVMSKFNFENRLECVGSDDVKHGTTMRTGIASLLSNCEKIDAFNFDPCGYSLNALTTCGNYATIHITPEAGASYVSFETTARNVSPAALVSRVVRTFAARRFTVSTVAAPGAPSPVVPYLNFDVLHKLLGGVYATTAAPHMVKGDSVRRGYAASFAITAAHDWASTPLIPTAIPMYDSFTEMKDKNATSTSIQDAVSKGKNSSGTLTGSNKCEKNETGLSKPWRNEVSAKSSEAASAVHEPRPTILFDLARIARNVAKLRAIAPPHRLTLRFPVRCETDRNVLGLLRTLGLSFEAGGRADIALLESICVDRTRIALADPALSPRSSDLLGRVGRVVVGVPPVGALLWALRAAGVGTELRVALSGYEPDVIAEARATAAALQVVAVRTVTAANVSTGKTAKTAPAFADTKTIDTARAENGAARDSDAMTPSVGGEVACGNGGNAGAILMATSAAMAVGATEIVVVGGDAELVREAVNTVSGWGHVVAEVGSEVLRGAVGVELTITGRRARVGAGGMCSIDYFVDDGMYGVFAEKTLQGAKVLSPRVVLGDDVDKDGSVSMGCGQTVYRSTVWGPTCDSMDRVWDGWLAELPVGARLVFDDVGIGATAMGTNFNGLGSNYAVRYFGHGDNIINGEGDNISEELLASWGTELP